MFLVELNCVMFCLIIFAPQMKNVKTIKRQLVILVHLPEIVWYW